MKKSDTRDNGAGGNIVCGEQKSCRAFLTGFLVLLIGTASFFYWGGKKEVWFCDEIYTYESANGFEQEWPASYADEWMTGKSVEAFFSADSERLSLNDITIRLYNDHVPLYFWIFRVVSFFFFKGSGTVWIGLTINLFFYLLFLGLGYWIFFKLTEKPLLSGAVMLLTCVVNRLMLEQATVLRMYMMLLLAEILLLLGAFGVLKQLRREKMSPGIFLYLFGVSVMGFLTHYDYWIFYGVTAGLFCGWLLLSALRRQGRRFWASREFCCAAAWTGNFAASLLTTIELFPYCRWNLNRGKGQTALHSLFDFSAEKGEQILWGYGRLSISLFGEDFPVWAGLVLLFGMIFGGMFVLHRKKKGMMLAGTGLTVLAAQAYQVIVCFTLPDVWEERYLWGAFTIMALCMAWGSILAFQGIRDAVKERMKKSGEKGIREDWKKAACLRIAAGILFAGILAGELAVIDGGRGILYLSYPEKDMTLLKENREIPWIVYGPTVGVYSYYDWTLPEQICFLTGEGTPEDGKAVREMKGDSFVLYLYEDYLPEAMAFFEQELGKELEARFLTRSVNLAVYLVEKR